MKNCINPKFLVTATNMKYKDEITSRIINNAFECVILGKVSILGVAAIESECMAFPASLGVTLLFHQIEP